MNDWGADDTVRPVRRQAHDGAEEYLTEPMDVYAVDRDAVYMTVPAHEAGDNGVGDVNATLQEEKGAMKSIGGDGCDGKVRGRRLRAYTEWKFMYGEEGTADEKRWAGRQDEVLNDVGDVKVYALRVTKEEMEVANAEQEEREAHLVDLGCCGRQHRCQRLKKETGGGWLKICYAAMDGAPGKIIGIYMYTEEYHKFRRTDAREERAASTTSDDDDGWTVRRFLKWCIRESAMYRKLLSNN